MFKLYHLKAHQPENSYLNAAISKAEEREVGIEDKIKKNVMDCKCSKGRRNKICKEGKRDEKIMSIKTTKNCDSRLRVFNQVGSVVITQCKISDLKTI